MAAPAGGEGAQNQTQLVLGVEHVRCNGSLTHSAYLPNEDHSSDDTLHILLSFSKGHSRAVGC